MGKRLASLLWVGLGVIALTSAGAFAFNYDIRIATGSDDAEQHLNAGMDVTSTDTELPYEDDGTPSATDEQVAGLRFIVPVAKGAKITKAYVEFTCDETKGGTRPVNLIIEGQLAVNPPAFTTAANDITGRAPWTSAKVSWTVENWTTVGQKSQTPDISTILQEIIDQNGWTSGNALVIAFRDDKSKPSTGIRCADAYEDSTTTCALLHLEVFNPAANTPSPADGAIGVFMPLLGWSKGDNGILHNVYLGKTAELTEANLVSSNLPLTMYYHVAGLEPGATYYWRVDEVDIAGKTITGPVWSFVTQAETAYYPIPTDGSVDVSPTGALTWQAGLAAMKHHLYLGASLEDVTKGAAGTDKGELELAKTTYTLAGLDPVTTYYWRVDEIGLGNTVKTGAVWSFTTYLPVDDFESYTDKAGEEIFEAWIDGWTNNTGATVGNTTAPFAEQTIVHSGKQAMPMDYDNTKAPFYSEAYLEFAPVQNWTANELANLKLDFRGRGTNGAGALYLAVEDSSNKSAVVVHADPAAVTATTWKEWKIPLSSLSGVNLAKVKRLYLGVGDRANPAAGGAGRLYIDDIRVTK